MIYLKFPESNIEVENWRERLDNLIVGYKAVLSPALEHPLIVEGKQAYVGIDAIEQFLKELEEEVKDWRTPRCGV